MPSFMTMNPIPLVKRDVTPNLLTPAVYSCSSSVVERRNIIHNIRAVILSVITHFIPSPSFLLIVMISTMQEEQTGRYSSETFCLQMASK